MLLDLLDCVRASLVDVVILHSLSSTGSRARGVESGDQRPLQTRSKPLELDGWSPSAVAIIHTDNLHCELVALFAEEASLCPEHRFALLLFFTEDVGGRAVA